MTPTLVDIGFNLTHESFTPDRDALLVRARDAGVEHMLVTGSSIAASRDALTLARLHPGRLRATAGIHPHHAAEIDAHTAESLRALLEQPEIVAVGECGLDYFRNFSPPEAQQAAFALQLGLSAEVGKPVFLHQRDAHEPFVELLRSHRSRLPGGVAHCFTAGIAEARIYLELDLYIGITGWICDERRGAHLDDVVRYVPRDRLLVETDAPYLLPRDLLPKPASRRNEPAFLPHIVARIARARGEQVAELAAATTANAHRLFGWPDPPTG